MDLRDVQAALTELERQMKKVANKIKHREKQEADALADRKKLEREFNDLLDRHIALGADERRLLDSDKDTDDDA